jgi:hypothetical protein
MPVRNVYVPDDDLPHWNEVARIAERRKISLSKQVCELVRNYSQESSSGRDLGLPVGFRIPASMKDPRVVAAEAVADDIRAKALASMLDIINMEVTE